jgi:hypothetical protein
VRCDGWLQLCQCLIADTHETADEGDGRIDVRFHAVTHAVDWFFPAPFRSPAIASPSALSVRARLRRGLCQSPSRSPGQREQRPLGARCDLRRRRCPRQKRPRPCKPCNHRKTNPQQPQDLRPQNYHPTRTKAPRLVRCLRRISHRSNAIALPHPFVLVDRLPKVG